MRWNGKPHCPHCGCTHVAQKQDGDRVGRWNCHGCKSSFNVLSGSIFEKTRIELQKWFLGIAIIINAKKSVSSCQLARDLDLTQPTALRMQRCIRAAMMTSDKSFLQGIVEADETYVGGKPRKGNNRDNDKPGKRGRGTKKVPVIGAVERGGGSVFAQVAENLNEKGISAFLKNNVDPQGTLLITDEYRGYNAAKKIYQSATINHQKSYADGDTHTNTIEGFWALVKRAWYGSHHHYSTRWMPLYIAESCWKYNHRNNGDAFGSFMRGCFS